jgi:hypothetical protein
MGVQDGAERMAKRIPELILLHEGLVFNDFLRYFQPPVDFPLEQK